MITNFLKRIVKNPFSLLGGPFVGGYNLAAGLNDFIQEGGFKNYNLLKRIEGVTDSVSPGALGSYINAYTGGGPTGVQLWQAQREDTGYQRASADLEAAGLNKAMMYGRSVQPAPSSAGGNSSPGSFSDMLELAILPAQLANLKADKDVKQAQANELNSRADLNSQLKNFNDEINPLRVKAQELANNLSSAEERKIYRQMDEIAENIKKLAAETESEQERKALIVAQAFTEKARAWQITELTAYEKMLKSAQTSAAKAAAALSAVNAAYQQRLLDSNYLDDMFREMSAKASSAESRAQMEQIRASIRNGTFGVQELGDNVIADTIEAIQSFGSQTLAGFVNFVDNLNPFGSMLK